jgi:cystathionine beta-lyase
LETPSNPTLKISDIAGLAELAHAAGAWLCVDNTFASPVLQQPILLGADLVVHSATKYLGGHSDLIAGAVVAATEELGKQIQFIQNASGAILGPFDSFLVIRGLETLHLRIAQHCSAALKVAQFLQTRPEISAVYYPGLESHPNHALAKQQQPDGFGGIIAFVLNEDTVEAATQLATSLQYFKLAVSLGGGKSLVCHSASMTHTAIPAETRRAAGFADSLLRLSIGLEAADDLIIDLARALDSLSAPVAVPEALESEAVLA